VVHEWWGLTDHVRGRARMLAELGYAALASTCTAAARWRTIPRMPAGS
jgi:dienelactone hydrolase